MKDLFLLAKINGVDVAISSDYVDSVIKVSDPVPAPSTPPIVAGLFALRSRVLTLIDCQYRVTGETQAIHSDHVTIVVKISGFHYGLLVDDVSDVCTLELSETEIHGSLSKGWECITTGMVELDGKTLLIVDPQLLIDERVQLAA